MNNTRYLTKTLFVKALECPTKLYYHGKKNEYAVIEANDFEKALQEGGFQVGELAKCYYPEGREIKTREHNEAVRQTNELLKQENAVIYEAAVRYDRFFIRVDILKKEGNEIHLIEVKTKSIDPDDKKKSFENKAKGEGHSNSKLKSYIDDAAFQTWVMEQAFPEFKVIPYLMLADKSKVATVNGLNQMFRVKKINGRIVVQRTFDKLTPDMLGNKILTEFPVREYVHKMINEGIAINPDGVKPLGELANEYADYYINDRQYPITIQNRCKKCEFKLDDENLKKGLKSGYEECMAKSFSNFAPDKPTVMDIWDFRDANKLLDSGIYEMKDALKYLEDKNNSDRIERQLLQVRKTCFERDGKEDVKPKLFDEMNKWRFPLHFVDFEGSRAAIPFNAGTSPYEQIAFQFSCHTLYESGEIKHIEWIKRESGEFPNFEFIMALKDVLDKDNGTIFRFHIYENTVLREIHSQLEKIKPKAVDYKSLMDWIDTITKNGSRNMVDLHEMVRKYYYHPDMGGSNSIKDILPAVLSASRFLKDKYSKPLNFGTNLMGKVWWKNDAVSGKAIDPYKLLRENFDDNRDVINDGGGAMTAFGKLQFTDIPEEERKEIISDLLRYCELDTLAMLMLYEHWRSLRDSN
ncbi:MAG TPA: DUF2779 domain-containing protein [Nitrospinae bacterium]|nr:DUF2779 domain-containing protein [Nitrospinota bacterium]